jgi:peptide-methionine (S)-S-oxide reductase
VFGLFGSPSPAAGGTNTTGGTIAAMVHNLPHAVLGTPIDAEPGPGQAEALFGCGCFWGAEKGFWRLPGVITTAVGYAGGTLADPTYNQVCSGRTGHAEVVRVVWDAGRISFADLLKLFWECHDPTQGDRQGNDRGSQYRSAIYVSGADQLAEAEASRRAYGALLAQALVSTSLFLNSSNTDPSTSRAITSRTSYCVDSDGGTIPSSSLMS